MHLCCSYRAELCRQEYSSYIHEYQIDIKEDATAFDDRGQEIGVEWLLGRVLIDKLLWQTAQIDGEALADICDEDSAGWYEVHQTIADPDDPQELRDDLCVETGVADVLFLHRLLLHPDIADRSAALNAIIQAVTGDDAIVVMWQRAGNNTPLSEQEYVALGFKKIAGSDLIYCDCHCQTPFGKANPRGKQVEVAAAAEHEEWVLTEWEHDGH